MTEKRFNGLLDFWRAWDANESSRGSKGNEPLRGRPLREKSPNIALETRAITGPFDRVRAHAVAYLNRGIFFHDDSQRAARFIYA